MKIIQIRVGKPREVETESGVVYTSLLKQEVKGLIKVSKDRLTGDDWGNLKFHGTPTQIICAYPEKHYDYWDSWGGEQNFPLGAFGENFIVRGCDETTVRIGDVYRIGEVLVEITHPRQPCSTLDKVWNNRKLHIY